MRIIRSIFLIINYKTFIVTTLAVISTLLCRHFSLQADFPLTIVGIAIVFPVVFSIDSAYKRRERTLVLLSDFKAHLNAIYLASRDWIDPKHSTFRDELKIRLLASYNSLKEYCTVPPSSLEEAEKQVYLEIGNISKLAQNFRGMDMNLSEVSRINQYISKLAVAMENIKVIRQYRTPVTLRAYSKVFIYSFPILYGPYFVHSAQDYSHGLEFFMPVVFSFILVSLDNIQEHLENPFDQIGEDDVKFDVEAFGDNLK